MTIRHMRIFAAVYREMNITRAAEGLHMTQPAVSRAIQELERGYGIRLFERINHRLYPTQAGEEFYARAVHILASFDELEQGVRSYEASGVLRVGASVTLGTLKLPGLARDFQQEYPGYQVRVSISNAEAVEQNILNNELDVGLIEGATSARHIHAEALREDRLRVILPPGHPLLGQENVVLRDLMAYPLLLREEGSAARALLDHVFAAHGLTPEPLWESISTRALINAVSMGLGISILAEDLVREDIPAGRVATIELQDEAFRRVNYIIWHEQKYLTQALKGFIALCQAGKKGEKGGSAR